MWRLICHIKWYIYNTDTTKNVPAHWCAIACFTEYWLSEWHWEMHTHIHVTPVWCSCIFSKSISVVSSLVFSINYGIMCLSASLTWEIFTPRHLLLPLAFITFIMASQRLRHLIIFRSTYISTYIHASIRMDVANHTVDTRCLLLLWWWWG